MHRQVSAARRRLTGPPRQQRRVDFRDVLAAAARLRRARPNALGRVVIPVTSTPAERSRRGCSTVQPRDPRRRRRSRKPNRARYPRKSRGARHQVERSTRSQPPRWSPPGQTRRARLRLHARRSARSAHDDPVVVLWYGRRCAQTIAMSIVAMPPPDPAPAWSNGHLVALNSSWRHFHEVLPGTQSPAPRIVPSCRQADSILLDARARRTVR